MKINLLLVVAAAAVVVVVVVVVVVSLARSPLGFICTPPLPLPLHRPLPLPPTVGVPLPPPVLFLLAARGPLQQQPAAFVFVTSSVMVMLYEGEDFANADRPTDRATAPPVGTAAPPPPQCTMAWISPGSVSRTSCMAIFPASASAAPFPCDAAAAGEH